MRTFTFKLVGEDADGDTWTFAEADIRRDDGEDKATVHLTDGGYEGYNRMVAAAIAEQISNMLNGRDIPDHMRFRKEDTE